MFNDFLTVLVRNECAESQTHRVDTKTCAVQRQANGTGDSLSLHVAQIRTDDGFSVASQEVISTHPMSFGFARLFVMHPSGERLLVMEQGATEGGQLVLVQNFFEELKALGR